MTNVLTMISITEFAGFAGSECMGRIRNGAVTNSPNNPGSGSQRSSATSRSLMERVRADDASAWDRLVSLYAPLVFYWCRRADLQEEDAADVLQEVFLAVATHLRGFRKDWPGYTFWG